MAAQGRQTTQLSDVTEKLVQATLECLYEVGIRDLSLELITSRAQLSLNQIQPKYTNVDELLILSMQRVSDRFEQTVQQKLGRSFDDGLKGLLELVNVYLNTDLSDPTHITIWHTFLADSRLRELYKDRFDQDDIAFARLVRSLFGRTVCSHRVSEVDIDSVSAGLVALLQLQWQHIIRQGPGFDRDKAEALCVAYIRNTCRCLKCD